MKVDHVPHRNVIDDGSPRIKNDSPPLHVAVIDEELPYPPNSGKRIRSLNLILRLASRHKITYVCHRNGDASEESDAEHYFRQHGVQTVIADRTVPRQRGIAFYGRLAANLLSPQPYSVQVHKSRALQEAVRRYDRSHQVDLWHCEWTPYGETLDGLVRSPWIVMAHNVESLIWQRYYETESHPLKRWYIKRQWDKFVQFERRMFTRASQTVAVSEPDARLIQKDFGGRHVMVVDNGVDVAYFRPTGAPREPNTILFLGSLDWRPNIDGVRQLLLSVLPAVRAEEEHARLCIVGRNPPSWLVETAKRSEHVELHANVPDVRPFLSKCALMAVPLRIGGGSRLKILEALAMECPVVSTAIGAEGLDLGPDTHFAKVDDVAAMPGAIVRCLRDPQAAVLMGRRGRERVVERYDWSVLADKLEAVWFTLLQSRS